MMRQTSQQFNKALEELQAFEKKNIHDLCLRSKVKWLEKKVMKLKGFFFHNEDCGLWLQIMQLEDDQGRCRSLFTELN